MLREIPNTGDVGNAEIFFPIQMKI